jgi:ABC-type sugar transport system permease subunit
VYPFLYAIWLSFLEKSVGTVGQFVGLRNFSYVITWPQFLAALKNTATFTIVAIAIKFVLGMSVALVLNQHIRGRNFFRAFLLLPWVIPAFVVYLTWRWLYDPLQGLLNYALLDTGLITRPIAFLSDKSTAMLSVIIAHSWRGFPFFAISFLAGMQTISLELYEAAQVDGATRWQQFRHITLPSLYHIIGVVLLLQTIWTANAFEPIYLLTGGGPSDATTVYTMLVYLMGMVNLRLGEAAAVSVLFLPLLIGLVLVVTGLLQRRGEE